MNQQLTTSTTTQNNAIGMALLSPRAVDAQPRQLEFVLAQAMAKAFADMGIKADERRNEIAYLVQQMPAQVTLNLPCIRLDEIPVAINRGILQQFGPFYGLNVATFMHFLITYYQSEQRLNAVKTNLAAATVALEPQIPTPQQQQQNRLNRMATAFARYKAEGFYNDYGSLVFDSINKLGKIPFDTQRESQILAQAKQNLINRYSRVSVYPDERAKLRGTLNQIMQGEAPNRIITEAKRITLAALFDELIANGMDILEWVMEENHDLKFNNQGDKTKSTQNQDKLSPSS
jgi:hypothetical protein